MSYRKHLEDRKRRTLIMTGAVADSALSRNLLSIVFLNDPEGVGTFGDTLAAGWPALIDLGATYGTAFLDSARPDVGAARLEQPSLVTVSMIARLSDALRWMEMDKLHPTVATSIHQGLLALFQKIVFVRFPANQLGRNLGEHCINEDGEIQVMCFPEDDPVLAYLAEKYEIRQYEVRSSNISGNPEEPFAPGAVEYACAIAAPVVAVSSLEALEAQMVDQALYKQKLIPQMRRKRFGSFPIIRLARRGENPADPPVFPIVRAGNTAPETLMRLIKGCLPEAVVIHQEEKQGPARVEYASPYATPGDIQADLLRAASEASVLGEPGG